MGCSCSGKKVISIKMRDEMKEEKNWYDLGLPSIELVLVASVWTTSNSVLDSLFPIKFLTVDSSEKRTIKVNLVPFTPDFEQISDALVFLAGSKAEKKEIEKLCEVKKNVPLKFLISSNTQVKIKGLKTVSSKEDFLSALVSQYFLVDSLLKGIFLEVDQDSDGLITLQDLAFLSNESGISKMKLEIISGFENSDLDKTQNLSLKDFIFSYKRGRQGAMSLKNLLTSWTDKISIYLPLFNKKTEISLEKYKKTLSFNQSKTLNPGFKLTASIGNGSKRESILRSTNEQLDFYIYDLWFSFKLEFESEIIAKCNVSSIETMIESLKSLLLSNLTNSSEIENYILINSRQIGPEIFIFLAFDITNDVVEESLNFVQIFDELLRSPTDDYVEAEIKTSTFFTDFQKCEFFKDHQEKTSFFVRGENWKFFSQKIQPKNLTENLLHRFLELNEETEVRSEWLTGFPALNKVVLFFLSPLFKIWKSSFHVRDVFSQFGRELKNKIEFFFRIGSYGGSVILSDEKLSKIFEDS